MAFKVKFAYTLGTFQTAIFLLSFGASETAHKPSERGVSISYSTFEPPDINPVGFPGKTFWELISSIHLPGVGVHSVGHQPFTLEEAPAW